MKPVNKMYFWLGVLWALPVTVLAWLVAVLLRPTGTRWAVLRYGSMPAVVAWGGGVAWILQRLPFGAVAGMTLGHVVWLSNRWSVRPIGAHEFAHVRQYAWLGALFPFVYGLESAWQWLRGRHYYFDNRFERAAYQKGRERFARSFKTVVNRHEDTSA